MRMYKNMEILRIKLQQNSDHYRCEYYGFSHLGHSTSFKV